MIKDKLNAVHIYPTNKCHLNCEYCRHKKDNETMSIETAEKIIKYLESIDIKALTFYGGEPLLNFPVVKMFIDRLKHKLKIGLATNGIELKGEIAEYLAKEIDVTVLVSIDPNMERRTSKYKNEIMENARNFIKLRHSYGGIVEVNSVVYNPNEQEYYNNEFNDYLKNDLMFDSINNTCIGDQSLSVVASDAKKWLLKGFRPSNISINEYIRAYDDIDDTKILSDCFKCEAGDKQITFAANGAIYACYKFYNFRKFEIGSIDTGIDDNKLKEWFEYKSNRMKSCKNCKYIKVCKGGCSYSHFTDTQEVHKNSDKYCKNRRKYLDKGKEIYDEVVSKGSKLNISLLESRRYWTGYGKRYFDNIDNQYSNIEINDKDMNELFIPKSEEYNIHTNDRENYTLYIYSSKKIYKISKEVACVLEVGSNHGLNGTIYYLMKIQGYKQVEAEKIVDGILKKCGKLF